MRKLAALLAAAALAGGLAACGGGGGGSTSTASSETATRAESTSAPTTAAQAPEPKRPTERSPRHAHRESPRIAPALKRKAGAAAPFLVPHADNSVPTYGSEASASQRAGAEAALAAFLAARARGDWANACAYLAASTRSRLEQLAKPSNGKPAGCGPILKMFAGSGPPASLADPLTGGLLSLRVKGASAFALWVGPKRQEYAMPMASEGGAWKVTQIAPLPYPPGTPAPTSR
jgi:hypothetical protein